MAVAYGLSLTSQNALIHPICLLLKKNQHVLQIRGMATTIGFKLSRPFVLKTNALLNKLKVKPIT